MEEAAARLLCHSVMANQWVGVELAVIIDGVKNDYDAYQHAGKAKERNWQKRESHARAMSRYMLLTIFTLGIYTLFAKKPTLELETVPENNNLPFSIVYLHPGMVVNAFARLIHEFKLVELVMQNDRQILFPTAKLVELINTPGIWPRDLKA